MKDRRPRKLKKKAKRLNDKMLPILISYDFNVNPMTCIIAQEVASIATAESTQKVIIEIKPWREFAK